MGSRPVQDEAEFIVVGTGAGGGTVARELARNDKNVLILEKGREYQRLGSYLTLAHMYWNKGTVRSREGYVSSSAIMTGGSTVVTAGSFWDPPMGVPPSPFTVPAMVGHIPAAQ